MSTPFTMLVGGVLPFGAVFIELFFIMSSVWLQRFYYVFGFLALVRCHDALLRRRLTWASPVPTVNPHPIPLGGALWRRCCSSSS